MELKLVSVARISNLLLFSHLLVISTLIEMEEMKHDASLIFFPSPSSFLFSVYILMLQTYT